MGNHVIKSKSQSGLVPCPWHKLYVWCDPVIGYGLSKIDGGMYQTKDFRSFMTLRILDYIFYK